jgi:hypothetical protein
VEERHAKKKEVHPKRDDNVRKITVVEREKGAVSACETDLVLV